MAVEKFIELSEFGVLNRGRIINLLEYKNERRDYEAYTSLFFFKHDVVDYVNNNINNESKRPSIAGFIGECSANYLWIDIDVSGNLQEATDMVKHIVLKIEAKYEISYRSLVIYFSGSKGYHIGIPVECFGAKEYWSDLVPKIFKAMAQSITDNSSVIDTKIYHVNRLFRCPMSRHPKTGNYKIPVDYTILSNDGGLDEILTYSKDARVHSRYKLKVEVSEKLTKLFEDCTITQTTNIDLFEESDGYQKALSLKDNSSIFRLPDNGERNDLISRMAYRLFAVKDLKVNEITDIMKFIYESVNDHSRKQGWSRYAEMEMRMSINSAYSKTRIKAIKKVSVKNVSSMALQMYKEIKSSVYLPFFVQEINNDLGGGLKLGDSYSYIGRGGTMKSYMLQENIIDNVMKKKVSIYANMEMSETTWFDRVWKAIFHKSMTEMIADGELTDDNITEMCKQVEVQIEDNLQMYPGSNLDPSEITNLIREAEKELKKQVCLFGVDSISMMKTHGDNIGFNSGKMSKELKEVAKETNTTIISINHARTDCPTFERNVSDYVLGGQAFINNCDAYFSFSSVADKELSDVTKQIPDYVLMPGIKYVRFVNKRGTGNTIDKIIQFLPNGRIHALPDKPSSFDMQNTYTSDYH